MKAGLKWIAGALMAGALAACAPLSGGKPGRLMIAGGATSAENEEVYSRFMETLPADAVVGVLPTASGVPVESSGSAMKTLQRYAGSRRVELIDITVQTAGRASEAEFVERIDRCRGLWFTGGDQSRIVAAFRPAAGDTPGYAAARRVLERGGAIGGTSAGAAMMSDPMITGGRSDDALLGKLRTNGDDSGFGVSKGMGFFPFGLTDQHFLRRGRLGRLVVALERTGLPRGYGIEENCALQVDVAAGTMTALGPTPAVVVVDVTGEKKDGMARRGVRISLLNDGDCVDAGTGAIRVGGGREPVSASQGPSSGEPLPEAWSPGAVTAALNRLAQNPRAPAEMKSGAFSVTFSADARTRFYAAPASPDRITLIDVRLDIVPLAAGAGR